MTNESNESNADDSELGLPWDRAARRGDSRRDLALVLAWSLDEPDRIGEVAVCRGALCLGRGGPSGDDPSPRAVFVRARPGESAPRPPFTNSRLSRVHLAVEPVREGLRVRQLGRAQLRINGRALAEGVAQEGDVVEVHNAATFFVAMRTPEMSGATSMTPAFPFASPDAFGLVGESEAAWKMRAAYAFAASTERHVLLLGDSGAGKELAARSIHGLSARRPGPLIARNAATLPESLIDAELFGNTKNYPNVGMPERPGLIGEAHGGTLFLDEIAELPERCQVHLLRALDDDGEHQRLGESRPRKSSFKLVAATNRPVDALKHDLLARFVHRVNLVGLMERREDIPLIAGHLLQTMARGSRFVAERFFERRAGALAEPRLEPTLISRLLRHPFTHHVRELERLLWLAIETAEHDYIGMTPAVEAELRDSAESASETAEVTREDLVRALADHGRSPTKMAKLLGLKNRYVLIRLLKKHGLSAGPEETGGAS